MATQIARAELPLIRAAGGILLRGSPGGDEVMIVFRARHQDWTLPKGKLKADETFQEAALREVEEETGCRCDLGNYLGMISYAHQGVPKVVMFWRMQVREERPRSDGDEITQALWLPIPAAIECLTYAQEKTLLSHVALGRQSLQNTVAQPVESDSQVDIAAPEPPEPVQPEITETMATAAVAEVEPRSLQLASSSEPETVAKQVLEASPSPLAEQAPEVEPDSQQESVLEAPESETSPTLADSVPLLDVEPYLVGSGNAGEPVRELRSEEPALPQAPSRRLRLKPKKRALQQELDALRVEMAFLGRRHQPDDSWAEAAQQHLAIASLCVENKDPEGGWVALRAARRYAVRGLVAAELTARAQLLREESLGMLTWRGPAIQKILDVGDDCLTAARLADAMLLRDEDDAEQQLWEHTSSWRQGLLLVVCLIGAAAFAFSFYRSNAFQYHALLAFLGLLGAALSAAQQVNRRRDQGGMFNSITLLALVLAGAVTGLAADVIYEYIGHSVALKHAYQLAIYPLSFVLGYAAQRSFSHFAGRSRERTSVRY